MTVSNTQTRIAYVGDSITTDFPTDFIFISGTDVDVYVDGAQVVTGFSVTGGGGAVGTVEFLVAPALNAEVVIVRNTDLLQETDIPPNDPFPADTVERMSDKLTLIVQEHATELDRTLRLPPFAEVPGFELPYPLTPLYYWRNNAAGDNVEFVDLSAGSDATALAAALADPSDGNGIDMVANSIRLVPTIAALRNVNGAVVRPFAFVSGYYNAGDGGHSWRRLDPADTTTADDGIGCIVDASGGRWKLLKEERLNALQAGVVGDATDTSSAVQAAINYIQSAGVGTLYFPPAVAFYALDSGIVVDASRVAIDFGGNKISFLNMATGIAITINSGEDDPNLQNPLIHARGRISNGYLEGPGAAVTAVTAMLLIDNSGVGISSMSGASVTNCSFVNFAKDVQFGAGSFCSSFVHCNFTHITTPTATTYSINMPGGVTNSGERQNFQRCMWNNRDLILDMSNGNGGIRFHNCSLDYVSSKMFNITDGAVWVDECHIESDGDGDYWFNVDGANAALYVNDSELVVQAARTRSVFNCTDACESFGVSLSGLRIGGSHALQTLLVDGAGPVVARNLKTFNAYGQPTIAKWINLINNWSFESASIAEWSVVGSVVRSTAQAHSGTASLLVSGLVGSISTAQLSRACRPDQIPAITLWYFASGVSGSGVQPNIAVEFLDASGGTITYTPWATITADSGWTELRINPHTKTPTGTATIRLTAAVPLGSAAPRLYVDDVIFNIV